MSRVSYRQKKDNANEIPTEISYNEGRIAYCVSSAVACTCVIFEKSFVVEEWLMKPNEWQILPGDPEIPGVKCRPDGINFAVAVPDEQKADLVLKAKDSEELVRIPLQPEDRTGDVSAVFIKNMTPEKIGYYYEIEGRKVLDPYARLICDGVCRCVSDQFDWTGDVSPHIEVSDLLIYKIHVRGFTERSRAGVKNPGTFAGAAEKADYIKNLGFNAVELMPAYEWNDQLKVIPPYAKIEPAGARSSEITSPRNYWGYAEENYYFAPKQRYSSADDSVREFKEMVQTFHRAGIEVFMEMYFPARTLPALAYSAVRFWRREYHVDGFRFVGDGVPMEMLVRDPLLKSVKLIFDHVDTGWVYGNNIPKHKNVIESNNSFLENGRRLLKGDEGQITDFAEHLRKNPDEIGISNYMACVNGFTLADSVAYDWKHNEVNGEDNHDGSDLNFTWNCGTEGKTRKKTVIRLRNRQVRNALAYVFLAQGIPMLLAGDENGNSQNGNNNAYLSDNAVGWVDWGKGKNDLALCSFVKKLAAFRKAHPILHMKKHLRGIDYMNYGYPDVSYHDTRAWVADMSNSSRTLGVLYCGLYAKKEDGKPDDFIYAAFNAYWESHLFALPNLPAGYEWHAVIDTSAEQGKEFLKTGSEMILKDQKMILVSARSVLVFIGKKGKRKRKKKKTEDKKTEIKKTEATMTAPESPEVIEEKKPETSIPAPDSKTERQDT